MSTGFRRFKVTAKVPESTIITSFYLEPVDGQPLLPAKPGQYLPLRLRTENGIVPRTYSISADACDTQCTRITVKRETSPPHLPDVPAGIASSWLHDHVEVGSEIDVAGPRGSFTLDTTSEAPVVLLSGGVGQTPLLSMLHSLAKTQRRVWYLHACDNGQVHAMRDEVDALISASEGRMQAHYCYRQATAADLVDKRFHSEGLIDTALLQSLLPIDNYAFYLCGPTPFMVAMYEQLLALGVNENRIAYEFFGKSKSLAALVAETAHNDSQVNTKANTRRAAKNAPAALANLQHLTNPDARATTDHDEPASSTVVPARTADVVFRESGVTATWLASSESLLALAEQSGLNPEFSCRSGICGTCSCIIEQGEVEYFEEPLVQPDAGQVLICCCRPKGRVVLKL